MTSTPRTKHAFIPRFMLSAGVVAAGLVGLATSGCVATSADRKAEARAALRALDRIAADAGADALWVDTLDLSTVDQEWGAAQAGKSVDGHPLTLSGQVYPHGVGTHAYSELIIDLKGVARSFHAVVGVDDESKSLGSVVFIVEVDEVEVCRSPVLRGGAPSVMLSANVSGAQEMVLIVENGGDDINFDHADWASALLVLEPGATLRPAAVRLSPGPLPQIARGTPLEPAIHAPRVTGATPGRPFLFRIPATGQGPLRFVAEDLPDGLTLDVRTGIITGALQAEGTTDVSVTVSGPNGQATSTLTIVGGPRSLALTPPLGWNSWNVWGTAVDDAKVREAADMLVETGLAAHGFTYINIDDGWEAGRDAEGRIQCNEKFPDMKALADHVHSRGLKLGIYSSPGPRTCAGYEGSFGYEWLDAQTYAAWGIDLIKYDWCSYWDISQGQTEEELRRPYEIMRAALDDCGRDIVYSLCQYGMGEVWKWGADVGGNYWRTTGDIVDSWSSMSGIGFGQAGLAEYASPGHWNDPDMLVVGRVGWGPSLHPTKLTPNEQVTHISLWALLASPLLIGCDLCEMDEFTRALLTNPEVLEVSQDVLGRQATRVAAHKRLEVWSRPLADGSLAVGLFNRSRKDADVTARWEDLGLRGPQEVRDLWQRRGLGTFDNEVSATVARHGAVLLEVHPVAQNGERR